MTLPGGHLPCLRADVPAGAWGGQEKGRPSYTHLAHRLCSCRPSRRRSPQPAACLHPGPRGWAGLCREEETRYTDLELMTYQPDPRVAVAPILGQSRTPRSAGAGVQVRKGRESCLPPEGQLGCLLRVPLSCLPGE